MSTSAKQEEENVIGVVLVIVGRSDVTAGPHGTAAVDQVSLTAIGGLSASRNKVVNEFPGMWTRAACSLKN